MDFRFTIESLEMVNNNNLLHKGMQYIKYTPTENTQLILGTNGIGKTTLVRNGLNPLPPSSSEYLVGGYRKLVVSVNQERYTLTSTRTRSGMSHSFENEDGVELNDGHTALAQTQLCETILGYTDVTQKILFGHYNFAEMSVAERKDVLGRISPIDVDYATEIYQKIFRDSKSMANVIAHNELKIVEQLDRILSDDECAQLESSIVKLSEALEQLLIERQAKCDAFTPGDSERLATINTRMMQLSKALIEYMPVTEYESHPAELFDALVAENHQLRAVKSSELSSKLDQYGELEQIVKESQHHDSRTIDDVEKEISTLKSEIQTVDTDISDYTDPVRAYSDLDYIHSSISTILLQLPQNPDLSVYSTSLIAEATAAATELQTTIDHMTNQREWINNKLSHMESHDEQKCPNCTHVWIPGVSPGAIEVMRTKRDNLTAALQGLSQRLSVRTSYLTDASQWEALTRNLDALMGRYPQLEPLWRTFGTNGELHRSPGSLIPVVDRTLYQLRIAARNHQIQDELNQLEQIVEIKRHLEKTNVPAIKQRMDKITQEIEVIQEMLNSLNNQASALDQANVRRSNIVKSVERLVELHDEADELYVKGLNADMDAEIASKVVEVQSDIATFTSKLRDSIVLKGIVKHLQDTLAESRREHSALKEIAKILSPTEGYISEILGEFAADIASKMTTIIRNIWTTPLTISPCSVTAKGALDYQFPFYADDPTNNRTDISQGSMGELEIINLAFRLAAMMYMSLHGYPFFMDEVGAHMSEQHRRRLYEYIMSLQEAGILGQVFIISHFPSTLAVLTNYDKNVMDPTGVMMDSKTNRCLTMS